MIRALPVLLLLSGCERLPSPTGAFAAAPDCDAAAIRAEAERQGVRTALEPCGSNPLRWFSWSPDGRHLLFALDEGAYVVDAGTDGKDTTRLPADPAGPGAWVGPARVAFPTRAADPARLALIDLATGATEGWDLPGLSDPIDLVSGPTHLFFSAVRDGRRRIVAVDLADGRLSEPFPWAADLAVDRFSLQPARDAVVIGAGHDVFLYDTAGTRLGAWSLATRGTLHPGGRWLALEEPSPPGAIALLDLVTGQRVGLEGLRGTDFQWYEAADYYGSLRSSRLGDATTPPNVVLGDLGPRLSRAEISYAAADPGR